MSDVLDVTVVIPTIGRIGPLRACLDSIAACDDRPAEVVVVDQSGDGKVAELVREYEAIGARQIASAGRGIPVGMNLGLRSASNDIVLVTHDDCTVDRSWIGAAAGFMSEDPEMIVSGRVLAAGDDPLAVPSTRTSTEPHDYTGETECGALYPNNMALNRVEVLAFGGFDERFTSAAEDNDLSYRWLRAGRRLRYEPSMLVWHNDWRSRDDLERLYVSYWRWQGMFYAKHLRRGDLTMLRFMARDARDGARAMAARVVRGRPRWSDGRRGILRGLPAGLLAGWRLFRGEEKA